jgi:copper(I)-binding protein
MIRAASLALVSVALTLLAARATSAGDATPVPQPPVTPSAAYAGAEIPGAIPVSLTIENNGDTPDVLLGGSTPIADHVEVHSTRLISGYRQMFSLPDGLPIPPGARRTLEPGADHLMLYGLRETLVQGRTFPLTLHFARAGEVSVTGRVRRKVDAAGITPFPPVTAGALSVSLVAAPPALAADAFATPRRGTTVP